MRPPDDLENPPTSEEQRYIWWFEREVDVDESVYPCFSLCFDPPGLNMGLAGFPKDHHSATLLCRYIGIDESRAPRLHTALSQLHSALEVVDSAATKYPFLAALACGLDGIMFMTTAGIIPLLIGLLCCIKSSHGKSSRFEIPYHEVIACYQERFCYLGIKISLHFKARRPFQLPPHRWKGQAIVFQRRNLPVASDETGSLSSEGSSHDV